jgi:hypothetical protein
MPRVYSSISLTIFLSIFISSCSPSKLSQCQEIFTIINTVNNEAKPLKNKPSNDLNNWLEAADTIQKAAETMKTLAIKDPQLQEYQENLTTSYSAYAQATRDAVKAFQNQDREAAQAAKIKVGEAGKLEQEVDQKINTYCRN